MVRNDRGEWVLLRHDLVRRAALDDTSFSSAVSRFPQVPNGLDGPEHTAFRAALDPFLSPAALAPYQADFERIAIELVTTLPRGASVEAVREVGAAFAVRAQSAWLGWAPELEGRLLDWIEDNHAATRSGEVARTAQVAEEFDDIIRSVLTERRDADPPTDVTGELLWVEVRGRRLTHAEIMSVLRNWTGGDLGSIALCAGVLVHHLASRPALQSRLRRGVPDAEMDLIVDEAACTGLHRQRRIRVRRRPTPTLKRSRRRATAWSSPMSTSRPTPKRHA